jgi:hypothetical protein
VRRTRDSRATWTPAWIRAVAAFVALLVAGDHGLASFHQALTAHEVCADHGELVHSASTHLEPAPHESGLGVEQGATAEAEHHHCGAVPAAPTRAPVVASSEPVVAPPLAVVPSSQSFESSALSADVLAYAPKQSPPPDVA